MAARTRESWSVSSPSPGWMPARMAMSWMSRAWASRQAPVSGLTQMPAATQGRWTRVDRAVDMALQGSANRRLRSLMSTAGCSFFQAATAASTILSTDGSAATVSSCGAATAPMPAAAAGVAGPGMTRRRLRGGCLRCMGRVGALVVQPAQAVMKALSHSREITSTCQSRVSADAAARRGDAWRA